MHSARGRSGAAHIDVARNAGQLAFVLELKGENEAKRLNEGAGLRSWRSSTRTWLTGCTPASFIRDVGEHDHPSFCCARAASASKRTARYLLVVNTAGELAESLLRNGQLDEALAVKQRDVAIHRRARAGHSSVAGSMAGLHQPGAARGPPKRRLLRASRSNNLAESPTRRWLTFRAS
jgi:hypothetical protein